MKLATISVSNTPAGLLVYAQANRLTNQPKRVAPAPCTARPTARSTNPSLFGRENLLGTQKQGIPAQELHSWPRFVTSSPSRGSQCPAA